MTDTIHDHGDHHDLGDHHKEDHHDEDSHKCCEMTLTRDGEDVKIMKYSHRFHQFTSARAIRKPHHMLEELLNNSIDAYSKDEKPYIMIDVGDGSYYRVLDKAGGITKEIFESRIRVTGSSETARTSHGMLGAGLKFIRFMGMVEIKSVSMSDGVPMFLHGGFWNDTYNVCQTKLQEYRPATIEDRLEMGLGPTDTGTQILLKLDELSAKRYYRPYNRLYNLLRDYFKIRKILSNLDNTILLRGILDGKEVTRRLYYEPPKGKKIWNSKYFVEGYSNEDGTPVEAHLTIYKTDEIIPYKPSSDEDDYGFIICSNTTTYENSAFHTDRDNRIDYMNGSDAIRYLRGELRCDYLDTITKNAADGLLSDLNPFLIIPHTRRGGLDRGHPFTESLMDNAYSILSITIDSLREQLANNLDLSTGLRDLFDKLSKNITKNIDLEPEFYTFRDKDTHKTLLTLDDRFDDFEMDEDFYKFDKKVLDELKDKGSTTINRKNTKGNIKAYLVEMSESPETPYVIHHYPDGKHIKLNADNPLVKDFIKKNEDGTYDYKNIGKSIVAVTGMVMDAAVDLKIRSNVLLDPAGSGMDTTALHNYSAMINRARKELGTGMIETSISSIGSTKENRA